MNGRTKWRLKSLFENVWAISLETLDEIAAENIEMQDKLVKTAEQQVLECPVFLQILPPFVYCDFKVLASKHAIWVYARASVVQPYAVATWSIRWMERDHFSRMRNVHVPLWLNSFQCTQKQHSRHLEWWCACHSVVNTVIYGKMQEEAA